MEVDRNNVQKIPVSKNLNLLKVFLKVNKVNAVMLADELGISAKRVYTFLNTHKATPETIEMVKNYMEYAHNKSEEQFLEMLNYKDIK